MNSQEQKVLDANFFIMQWEQLWPRGIPEKASGWSEQVQPGVNLLLDDTGDEAAPWLAVLTGAAAPAQGRVACAGLCSQADVQAYQAQVYWHNPRVPLQDKEISAAQWVAALAQHWPAWCDADWQAHCEGLGLAAHLSKPLWHLSTGCLRKLGLAAALASGARLTVIEEPIAALDSESIRYVCKALDVLGEKLAENPQDPRWIMVVHWEPLPSVTWDEVLVVPASADVGSS